jgi:enamine deaminase RidA (YjgF/YER057c/UK114 family)
MASKRVNPEQLAPPSGFSHAVVAHGRTQVFLAGQTAQGRDGAIVGEGLVAQFDRALANLVTALTAAGGTAEHLVKMTIYCTDPGEYTTNLAELGAVWRRRVGSDFPAMTLIGVTRLFDPAAVVELDAIAVVP